MALTARSVNCYTSLIFHSLKHFRSSRPGPARATGATTTVATRPTLSARARAAVPVRAPRGLPVARGVAAEAAPRRPTGPAAAASRRRTGTNGMRLLEQAHLSAAEHPELEPTTLLVVLALYRAFAVLDRNQAGEVARIGLNVTQFNVLMTLHRLGRGLTMGELASLLVVRPANLSGIVNALCERGLVRRDINMADQRSLMATITPAGERLLAGFLPSHWSQLARIMAGVGERERGTLILLLRRLIRSIETGRGAGAAADAWKGA